MTRADGHPEPTLPFDIDIPLAQAVDAPLRMATWNVNSVRARVDRLREMLQRNEIDVLAIQETKLADPAPLVASVTDLGYQVAHHGINQWNGVAVLSRVGLTDVQVGFPGQPGYGDPAALEARAISAVCAGIRIWSLYIPNGREVGHPHFDHKLRWVNALAAYSAAAIEADPELPMMLSGDFNIAPTDADVWSTAYYADKTHTTPHERAAFEAVVAAGLSDVVRPFTDAPGTFTYWDYQQLRFPKNRGMRIDFVMCSPALAARVTAARIDRDERKGKGASDHAPVIVDVTR